jgi:hypothetical protein
MESIEETDWCLCRVYFGPKDLHYENAGIPRELCQANYMGARRKTTEKEKETCLLVVQCLENGAFNRVILFYI